MATEEKGRWSRIKNDKSRMKLLQKCYYICSCIKRYDASMQLPCIYNGIPWDKGCDLGHLVTDDILTLLTCDADRGLMTPWIIIEASLTSGKQEQRNAWKYLMNYSHIPFWNHTAPFSKYGHLSQCPGNKIFRGNTRIFSHLGNAGKMGSNGVLQ